MSGKLEQHVLTITVDGSGDNTSYTLPVRGKVKQITYTPHGSTPLDTGADLVITNESTGGIIFDIDNIGTATVVWSPRQATHLNTSGAAALYAAGGSAVLSDIYVVDARIKVVTAQGGVSKIGTLTFVMDNSDGP